jgi:undecaprenyl-diphosphatase
MSVALYGILIYYVYKKMENKYLKVTVMTLLSLLIVGIGCSRIYLGVHYPSDVIAGYSLALVLLIIVIDWCNKNVKGE